MNNEIPLQVVKEKLPVVDLAKLAHRKYAALDGGQLISYQTYIAQSVSNTQQQITCNPPLGVIIDRKEMMVYLEATLTFAGTSSSGNLLQIGSNDAPRDWPFQHACATSSVTINNGSITTLTNNWFPALIRYRGMGLDEYNNSFSTPTQLDRCSDYSQLNATNRSPFVLYGENAYEDSRGAYSNITVVSNTSTAASVTIRVAEPLLIPGWYDDAGLANAKALNFLFTYSNLARAFWSHDATNGNNITSISVNITSFQMRFKFITPKIVDAIPKKLVYAYSDLVPYITTQSSSVSAAAQTTISMSSVNLQSFPKALYVWIQKQDSDMTYNDPDAFYRIDQINLVFNNATGLLASARIEDLYKLCHENGYNGSWNNYYKFGGAPIKLVAAKDFGFNSLEAPGMDGQPQLAMTVYATNLSSAASIPKLFVYAQYEGCMNIMESGSMTKSTAVLSKQDVLNSSLENAPQVAYHKNREIFGSGLSDDFKNAASNIVKTITDGVKLTSNLIPGLRDVIGNGYSGGDLVPFEGGRRKHKVKGKGVIDRQELLEQEYY